jgi:hypothetical protein
MVNAKRNRWSRAEVVMYVGLVVRHGVTRARHRNGDVSTLNPRVPIESWLRSPSRRPCFSLRRTEPRLQAERTDDCESGKESEPKLKVKVMDDARALVVTLPGTNYQITHRKLDNPPGISAAHDLRHDDPDASLNRYEFLARAWTIASEKARELGWIV